MNVLYFTLCNIFVFFFFKQKTAYEMRISDWSSDVCSSDLRPISRPRAVEWGFMVFCGGARVHAAFPCNIVQHFSRNVARGRPAPPGNTMKLHEAPSSRHGRRSSGGHAEPTPDRAHRPRDRRR